MNLPDLLLQGKKLNYESLPSEEQNLSFTFLEKQFKKITGIESFDKDILKTLSLLSNQSGYNIAASLLSDCNKFPCIDIAKFGDSISIIKKRACFEHISVLEAFEKAISFYKDFYQYEEIDGSFRKIVQTVPEAAFREAIANAIIHRTWDVNAQIRVLMFDDKIQVISPGGLPSGLTEDEYLLGRISVLRNPILANVFYRLNIVEIFGTGVLRIMDEYSRSFVKPKFEVSENSISIELPVIQKSLNLTEDEQTVYNTLSKSIGKSISEITAEVPFGKSKTHITDKMSLLKLLFFADRFHIRNFCVPMLCDSYTAMRQGPVCSKTYDLIKRGQYFDYLPLSKQKFVAKNLTCENETVVTACDTGDDYLSVSDKMALDFSIQHFGSFDRKILSKISHAYLEWNRFKTVLETEFSNAEEMSYSDFFDNPNPNDRYIKKYFNGLDPFDEDEESLNAKKIEYETILCR